MKRFALYGALGWIVEVCFTGIASTVRDQDYSGAARTFLCMHPIYGAGGLLLEQISHRAKALPRGARTGIYVALIYALEYATGSLLRACLGRCPWDYQRNGRNVNGLIQLHYAPAWLLLGLAFEPTRDMVSFVETIVDRRQSLPVRLLMRITGKS